jgi:hypothetical protein
LFEDYFPLFLIDHVTDDKEMVSVVLDFRPLGRSEDILQGEEMEIETVSEFSKKRNIVEPIHVIQFVMDGSNRSIKSSKVSICDSKIFSLSY